MAPERNVPPLPPLTTYRPSFERALLGSGPRRGPPPPGGGGRRPHTPRRGGGLLLGLVYLFLFVVIAGGSAVGYLVLNPPSDLIRQKIAVAVKAKTGRDLVMAGPAAFMFFPTLGVSLKDVSLSAPPGMDGKLVQIEALNVSVKAMTLLSKQVEINSIVLEKPVFEFRIDKTGHNNWQFATEPERARFAELQTPNSRRDFDPIQVADADQTPQSSKLGAISDLQVDDIRLEDGTLRFTDDRNGKVEQVSAVNAKLGLRSLSSPLTASGDFAWHDERVDFDGNVPDVRDLLSQSPAHLTFNAKSAKLTATYDGGLLIKDGVYIEGQVTAQSDSTRELANWFGTKLPPVTGFGPLSIEGTLKTSGNVTTFSNAEFGLDGATGKGTIKVTTGGIRPYVEANLQISELDLNKYLTSAVTGVIATEGGAGSEPAAPPALKPSEGDAPQAQPDEIQKLLNAQGSKVYGSEQREGWSSEKLNLTLLGVADGQAQLDVGRLKFKNVAIGQSSVAVAVKNHAMQATFNDVELYQGHGKGNVAIDGSQGTANIAANFNLDGISALPFLKDAADFAWIAGNAKVGLQLTANGASQLQLVESLNGKASFHFADGAIVGFNLPGAIRGISQGDFSALRKAPSEKTDFSALGATFTVNNGVAQNQDLELVSPLLRVTGGGTIHMPERTVDYTVKPKLVASLEGQEGDSAASGIEIPVRISGSWDKPKYTPDLNGVLSDPNKTVETIKEIGKKFKGKNAGEIVNDLLGSKANDDTETAKAKKNAKNFLNKLFGKSDNAQQGTTSDSAQ